MDLSNILKEYVNSVCKSAEFIEVLIANNTLVVNVADTSLGLIDLGFNTGFYKAFDCSDATQTNNPIIFNKIIHLWQYYENISNTLIPVASIEDLRTSEEYNELLAMKSSDGGGFYKIPGNNLYENYILPVFTGFPVINKADKVGIVVKRIDYGTLLMEYHIYKKKLNKDITIFFRTIDMNRRLIDEQFRIRKGE